MKDFSDISCSVDFVHPVIDSAARCSVLNGLEDDCCWPSHIISALIIHAVIVTSQFGGARRRKHGKKNASRHQLPAILSFKSLTGGFEKCAASTSRRHGYAPNALHAAIYLTHTYFGVSQRLTGIFFARDRSTVRHACARIEDARDLSSNDRALDALGLALNVFINAFQIGARQGEIAMTSTAASITNGSVSDRTTNSEAVKLLSLLVVSGAFAALDNLSDDTGLNIFQRKNGVSLRVAGCAIHVANYLQEKGWAFWEDGKNSGRRYLKLNEAGRAYAMRISTDTREEDGVPAAAEIRFERALVDVGNVKTEVLVDRMESPLAWLARRVDSKGKPFISGIQLEAGERLRRDIDQAQILPHVTASWNINATQGKHGGEALSITDIALSARQRMDLAFDAVGSEYAGLLIDVCGFLKGLRIVESERGWPQRSGKVILAMALTALARHYGLANFEKSAWGRNVLRHWGDSDYRPRLETGEGKIPGTIEDQTTGN